MIHFCMPRPGLVGRQLQPKTNLKESPFKIGVSGCKIKLWILFDPHFEMGVIFFKLFSNVF